MDVISQNMSHGGVQGVYKHVAKTTECEMTFAVFIPPTRETSPPVLWYLSGLTCNHSNVMEKVNTGKSQQNWELLSFVQTPAPEETMSLMRKIIGSLVQVQGFT